VYLEFFILACTIYILAPEICKMKLEEDSWEDSNSRYWFKIGKYLGVSIGIVAGAGAFAIGEMIGKIIVSKIES